MILSDASLSLAYRGTRTSENLSWQATYPEIKPYPEPRSSNLAKRHEQDAHKHAKLDTESSLVKFEIGFYWKKYWTSDDSLIKKCKASFGI